MIKPILFIISILILSACDKESLKYKHTIYSNEILNKEVIKNISEAEKALLCGYLYIYGNACNDTLMTIKCAILNELKIKNECKEEHRNFLKKWFVNSPIIYPKLGKCPALIPSIQNQIKKLVIERNADTMSIEIKVYGVNITQEKNWEIEQKEFYIVNNHSFIRLMK